MSVRGLDGSTYGGNYKATIKSYIGKHLVSVAGATPEQVTTRSKTRVWAPKFVLVNTANQELKEMLDKFGGSMDIDDGIVEGQFDTYYYDEIKRFVGAVTGNDPGADNVPWEQYVTAIERGEYNGTYLWCTVSAVPGAFFKRGKRAGQPVTETAYQKLDDEQLAKLKASAA